MTYINQLTDELSVAPADLTKVWFGVDNLNVGVTRSEKLKASNLATVLGLAGGGGTVQGTNGTYDIRATNEGATAGNARSENSVDLQTIRSAATMVASNGPGNAILSGGDNTTNSNYYGTAYSVIAGGFANSITGPSNFGFIGGGNLNSISSGAFGAQYASICGGANNSINNAIANGQFIGGGTGNVSNGDSAVVCGGQSNSALGDRSGVFGGATNSASATNAFAFGNLNTASGTNSVTLGGDSAEASGEFSATVGGSNNEASGDYSSAIGGQNNLASAIHSAAVGSKNTASGAYGTAFGYKNTASGNSTSAVGNDNTASGVSSSAFGYKSQATTLNSQVFGRQNFTGVTGLACVGLGILNNSSGGTLSSGTGVITGTIVSATIVGNLSTAVGIENLTSGDKSLAVGYLNVASGPSNAAAVGMNNTASGISNCSAFGYNNVASGGSGSAFGYSNTASGNYSSAFGYYNTASSSYSSAVGYSNTASSEYASAIGHSNTASSTGGTAVGFGNTASSNYTSAVGYSNTASKPESSAFGRGNTASGYYSSASGYKNTASGTNSVAMGFFSIASGDNSSAVGYRAKTTIANTFEAGYWSNTTTRGGAIRGDSTGLFQSTFRTNATASVDGGVTAGSEAVGTLGRGMGGFRVNGTSLFYDFNVAGTVTTKEIGAGVSPAYASIYVVGSSAVQVTNATGGTYDKVSGFLTDGEDLNMTAAAGSDKITVDVAGKYLVNFQCSFSGTNSAIIDLRLNVGGVAVPQCHCQRKLSSGGDIGSAGFTGIIDAAATDDVIVEVSADGSSDNFVARDMNLTLTKIG